MARVAVVRARPIRLVPPRLKGVHAGDQPRGRINPRPEARPLMRRRDVAGAALRDLPSTLEMHLAEYKAVNGIKFPHLITRGASGETNEEWVIKSYKVNPNLKANTFTK